MIIRFPVPKVQLTLIPSAARPKQPGTGIGDSRTQDHCQDTTGPSLAGRVQVRAPTLWNRKEPNLLR